MLSAAPLPDPVQPFPGQAAALLFLLEKALPGTAKVVPAAAVFAVGSVLFPGLPVLPLRPDHFGFVPISVWLL